MFEKLAITVTKKTAKPLPTLTMTLPFLEAVAENGHRLSYSALSLAAQELGDIVPTGQKEGQRGAKLLKSLPVRLQPFVCKKSGGYSKGVAWEGVDVPSDLGFRPVITEENVFQAVSIYLANQG